MKIRLLLAICLLIFPTGCSYEKVEHEIGHTGVARRDPFLAAQRFMDGREFTVGTATRFSEVMGPQNTIVTPVQSFVNHGMATAILNWVSRGGNLVVFLRDGEAIRNDWLTFSSKSFEGPDPETLVLLDELGVNSVEESETVAKGKIVDQAVEYKSPAFFTWQKGEKPRLEFALGDPNKPAAAAFLHGRGMITIVASAKPFRNRYIGEADNALAFYWLAGHAPTTGIWFVQGVRISFFAMLWEHGWMAIIALLLLIAFWLWRNLPRFGPLRQAPQETHRDFASHLGVIGAFQWQHGQSARLLTPLRENILRAAARRGWNAGDGPRLFEHLAVAAGFSPERAQSVMEAVPRDPQTFLAVVQDLQKIAIALRT